MFNSTFGKSEESQNNLSSPRLIMDEPVCKRGKLTDTDSTYTNTHLDEISDNELCLPFINQFSYDIDKQDITQNSSMEDSSRGIDQEPTPNNTVKEQIYWSFQSSIPAFPAYYHGQLSHDNDNSKSREIGTKYLVQADLLEVRYLQLNGQSHVIHIHKLAELYSAMYRYLSTLIQQHQEAI